MNREPVVVQESAREWETWPDEEIAEKGLVYWKTLDSGDLTQSEALTIDGKARPVAVGCAVFIPGNALHSCENTGTSDLRIAYVFAADSFEEIEYVFDE